MQEEEEDDPPPLRLRVWPPFSSFRGEEDRAWLTEAYSEEVSEEALLPPPEQEEPPVAPLGKREKLEEVEELSDEDFWSREWDRGGGIGFSRPAREKKKKGDEN